jgi:hypothetical protein
MVAVVPLALAIAKPRPITINVTGPGPHSAGYIAVEPGGYRAEGHWKITISRGTQTIELTNENSPPCSPLGTIKPGDRVQGEIYDPQSVLRVGENAHC